MISTIRESTQDAEAKQGHWLRGINGNIINDVYDSIMVTPFKIFKASLGEAVFPENLEIAKAISVFKKVKKTILKTTIQFSFFYFFPKCLKVLCIIVRNKEKIY